EVVPSKTPGSRGRTRRSRAAEQCGHTSRAGCRPRARADAASVDRSGEGLRRHVRQFSNARSFFLCYRSGTFLDSLMISPVNQFYQLTPDVIMEAVEKAGWSPTGEYLQLNSYENRVFSIRLEKEPFDIIAKFYRPGRWSRAALLEEHEFLAELK